MSKPWGSVGLVMFVDGRPSAAPLPAGGGAEWVGMREVGRAIRITPRREITPATCSLRVKGSWMRIEQAQQATIGAKKVMTVASDKGRY